MSSTYTDLNLTNFPEEVDSPDLMADPTEAQLAKISQYETLIREGRYDEAKRLIADDADLRKTQITATRLNRHEQMIIATQRLFLEDVEAKLNAYWEEKGGSVTRTAQSAKEESMAAKEIAQRAQTAVAVRTRNCIRVIKEGSFMMTPSVFAQNEKGLWEHEVSLTGLKTDSRLRWAIPASSIGVAMIAGVTCVKDGTLTIYCLAQPTGILTLQYSLEELVTEEVSA